MGPIPGSEDEQYWINGCRRGDAESFARLFEAYQAQAYGTALLIFRDRSLAADAVQETFIRIFLALPRFRPDQPFRPWFYRILTNETLRLVKRRRRWWSDGQVDALLPAALTTPESLALDRERAEEIWQTVSALPEASRAALVLRYYAGLTEEEMSAVMGVPPGTVKSRLSRARDRLKAWMLRRPEEEGSHV